jgi:adenylate cyclase class 2
VFEIEIKAPADHAALRSELVARDAAYEGSVYQVDTYYDHPCRSFEATDEAVRVRRERNRESGSDPHGLGEVPHGAEITLTYKGPRVDDSSKTRMEHEVVVESEDSLR